MRSTTHMFLDDETVIKASTSESDGNLPVKRWPIWLSLDTSAVFMSPDQADEIIRHLTAEVDAYRHDHPEEANTPS